METVYLTRERAKACGLISNGWIPVGNGKVGWVARDAMIWQAQAHLRIAEECRSWAGVEAARRCLSGELYRETTA